ncbi:DMT family transporter [Pseudomonas asplenii]|uniref:DMT family transporter n=1 Tax=Pseudomonas asplenii TaxID=53407 RepID=UPI002362D070|nr:DMT family transporter [Pseudomonas asplenii]
MKRYGVALGLLFCAVSAAFDVYVAFITQTISTLGVIFYCFSASAVSFLIYALYTGGASLVIKFKKDLMLVALVNGSVLLNWGGLFYALRYLEPAVVGVASVACGPAITLVVSAFDKKSTRASLVDTLVSYLVLVSVGIMLFNSFSGNSGVVHTSVEQRILGILAVITCALGTVLYTVFSKRLFAAAWATYEILAVRNVAMVILCAFFITVTGDGFSIGREWFWAMALLVFVGHLLPIYLIQKTIYHLSPLHVSLVLLALPVFVLLFQYLDSRVEFSIASVLAIGIIVVLLCGRGVVDIHTRMKKAR